LKERKKDGRIEVTRRLGRRRTQLLDDLKKKRGYGELKDEELDGAVWRTRFERGYGNVIRHYRIE
jgi:hypothetical protein